MDEQEKRVADLQLKRQQTNYEFVQGELDVCFFAVENGIRDLQLGNVDAAQEESQKAEKGYKTVVGFVAKLGEEWQQAEFEKRWNGLREKLDELQAMLKDSTA